MTPHLLKHHLDCIISSWKEWYTRPIWCWIHPVEPEEHRNWIWRRLNKTSQCQLHRHNHSDRGCSSHQLCLRHQLFLSQNKKNQKNNIRFQICQITHLHPDHLHQKECWKRQHQSLLVINRVASNQLRLSKKDNSKSKNKRKQMKMSKN